MEVIRFAVISFFILFSFQGFSQNGTYEWTRKTPREAMDNFIDSTGAYEFPILVTSKGVTKPTTPSIRLKRINRFVYVRYNGEIIKGRWEIHGDTVKLTPTSNSEALEFTLVHYESGTYLESMDGRSHFMKN